VLCFAVKLYSWLKILTRKHLYSCNCEHKIQILYLHNTYQEIQKLATYVAKSLQLLGGGAKSWGFAPDPIDQGLYPITSAYSPQCLLLFLPKTRVSLDKRLRQRDQRKTGQTAIVVAR